jgi:predicted metal-dependent phosphoesterase TrpH
VPPRSRTRPQICCWPQVGFDMTIDLHTHSSCSDGTESPTQILQRAADAGLNVVALTDHDTIAGWEEARASAAGLPVTLVCGLEVSARIEAGGVHVLGYGFDGCNERLQSLLARIREARQCRLIAMIHRLRDQGIELSPDDFALQADAGVPMGRPHLADALVSLGHAETRGEAIHRWLRRGSPGYVERWSPDPFEAVTCVSRAGGVAVLAHPWGPTSRIAVSRDFIAALTDAGLAGIEVDHPDHNPTNREALRRIGADLALVTTGGSDYHGAGKAHGIGSATTRREQFDRLMALVDSS